MLVLLKRMSVIVAFFVAQTVTGEEWQWRVERSESPIRVGDPIRLQLLGSRDFPFEMGRKYRLQLAVTQEKISLYQLGWFFEPQEWEATQVQPDFFAVPLRGGDLEFPALNLVDVEGKKLGQVAPWKIQVASAMNGDSKKPPELLPPVSLAYPLWVLVLFWSSLMTAIVATIAALIYWIRRIQKKSRTVLRTRDQTEDEWALEALEQLARQNHLETGRYKKYYFGISETLKRYIARRYGIEAEESTSQEILKLLEQKGISNPVLDQLETFLEHLDLIKFTDTIPTKTESEQAIERARVWIRKTHRPRGVMESAGHAI